MLTKQQNKISSIESLSGDEILVKSVGREEVDWRMHSHSKHQLIYTLKGTLHITVGDERHFVTARHLVCIAAGTLHQLSSNNARISLMVCYYALPQPAGEPFAIFAANEFASCNLLKMGSLGLIEKSRSPEWFAFATGFLALLPYACERATFSLQPFVVPRSSRLYPILEYIAAHYADDLSIAGVAGEFALSVRNLTRMFTKAGIGFVSYLNYQRVVRALELLSDNAMSIEQISYEVGFSSPNSFNRVFKQITGHAPSSYLAHP